MENAKGEEDIALLEKLWALPVYIGKRPKPKKPSSHFWGTFRNGLLFSLIYIGVALNYAGFAEVYRELLSQERQKSTRKRNKGSSPGFGLRRKPYLITQIMDQGNERLGSPKNIKRAEKLERRRLATDEERDALFHLNETPDNDEGGGSFPSEKAFPEVASTAPAHIAFRITEEDRVVIWVFYGLCACFIVATIIGHC